MKNNKYLNLFLNILFFLLTTILWTISISIIIVNDKINVIIIPYIIFEILFVLNLVILFIQMFEFKDFKKHFKNQEFYLLISIFIVNIFVLNGCIGAAANDNRLLSNSGLLWSIFIFSFIIWFASAYYLVFWKLKLWNEQKNSEKIEEQ